ILCAKCRIFFIFQSETLPLCVFSFGKGITQTDGGVELASELSDEDIFESITTAIQSAQCIEGCNPIDTVSIPEEYSSMASPLIVPEAMTPLRNENGLMPEEYSSMASPLIVPVVQNLVRIVFSVEALRLGLDIWEHFFDRKERYWEWLSSNEGNINMLEINLLVLCLIDYDLENNLVIALTLGDCH
ncbi:MAG: hypothetical protein OXC57_14380, partial [Rhodobacteraceae bacterium]|nr:hypothetical protein [Paracoccaceae bacterium]